MGSCVMSEPPKLHVKIRRVSCSAEGALAIGAALVIVCGSDSILSVLGFRQSCPTMVAGFEAAVLNALCPLALAVALALGVARIPGAWG
jgi:hypothetical protein